MSLIARFPPATTSHAISLRMPSRGSTNISPAVKHRPATPKTLPSNIHSPPRPIEIRQNEVLDMLANVHFDRAAGVEAGANLAEDGVSPAPALAAQVAQQRARFSLSILV
jgi:hypothetical protein